MISTGALRATLRRFKSRLRPRHLRRRSGAVVLDLARLPYMGFGATIAWLHVAHVAAEAVGARLEIRNPAGWPFGGGRSECALDRFIVLPSTPRGADTVDFDPGSKPNLARWGYYDELDWSGCLFGWRAPGSASLEAYRRGVMARAYVPTRFAGEAIDARLTGLPARCIAWHVRRGDKTAGPAKEDEAVPLERYAEATRAWLRATRDPPRHLVVCSDSPAVIEEARGVAPGLDLQLVVDGSEKRWDGYCALHRAGRVTDAAEMVEEILTAQKVIETLRRAEFRVGCDSSYLFRVAVMLGPARHVSLSENKRFRPYFPL